MRTILVIRNSALGDVAMVRPCLLAFRHKYPDVKVILLTKASFNPLFNDIPNIEFVNPDYDNKHHGASGLIRLANEIHKTWKIDAVIDLHDVIRSKVIRTFFKTAGKPVFSIQKDRRSRKDLIQGKSKKQLPHSVELYSNVFKQAGFDLNPFTISNSAKSGLMLPKGLKLAERPVLKIGVAPFAKHPLKIWPAQHMVDLMKLIQKDYSVHYYWLGGKEDEVALQPLAATFPNSTIVAGKYSMDEELAIIGKLDFAITMDSANMHLSSIMNTKVFSIWGATDPLAGFYAWGQPKEYSIRISTDELNCRPCTIFGKGECKRKDFACMNNLTAIKVFDELKRLEAFT